MGENATGPVAHPGNRDVREEEVNTCEFVLLDLEFLTLCSQGLFSLPSHWSCCILKMLKITVNVPNGPAFCFGQRLQLCGMSESILALVKH